MLEMAAGDKDTSFLKIFANYERKRFITSGPVVADVTLSFSFSLALRTLKAVFSQPFLGLSLLEWST
jgi:hypothetical protein